MMQAMIGSTSVEHITRAEWTDGIGDVADSCAIQYMGDPAIPASGAITLSPDGGTTVYGPYDIISQAISGEERTRRVSGRVGYHFEAEISDRDDEEAIYGAIVSAVEAYSGQAPWSSWLSGVDARYMIDRVSAELFRASTLGSVRQVLGRWGLTVTPTATLSGSDISHSVDVRPLYPVATDRSARLPGGARASSVLRLDDAIIEAYPQVEYPDAANPPRAYRSRRIVGMHRRLGVIVDDPVLVSSGSMRPAVYLSPSGDLISMGLEAHITRWRHQNSAARMRGTVWSGELAGLVPQRIVSIAAEQMDLPRRSIWTVEQARHMWDGERGYRVEATATLWQGWPSTVPIATQSLSGQA